MNKFLEYFIKNGKSWDGIMFLVICLYFLHKVHWECEVVILNAVPTVICCINASAAISIYYAMAGNHIFIRTKTFYWFKWLFLYYEYIYIYIYIYFNLLLAFINYEFFSSWFAMRLFLWIKINICIILIEKWFPEIMCYQLIQKN